jgi:hypothetical protein
MTSDTELSAFASVFRSELRRAACTGGVGSGAFGSFNFSYSTLAVVPDVPDATAALDRATWSGTSGCNSDGVEPDGPENNEPPSNGFLPVERDLSISRYYEHQVQQMGWDNLTIHSSLDGILDWRLEDIPLPPDLNHTSELLLNIVGCTFVCNCHRFGNYLDRVSIAASLDVGTINTNR